MAKVVFMGADAVGLPLLEVLRARTQDLCVVSQPDRPVGRGQKMTPNEVSAWALQHKIILHRPEKLDDEFYQTLKNYAPDLILVMAYGRLLKQRFLELPRVGIWNLHASLLPQLRGASPLETAIAEGYSQTGVMLMRMVLGMDEGDMGPKKTVAITETTTAPELRVAAATAAAELVQEHWTGLCENSLPVQPQNHTQATYCRILTKDDSWLDPACPAVELARRVRAFSTWVGSALSYGSERLKIYSATAMPDIPTQQPPGSVLRSDTELWMATASGVLRLDILQRAGGKRLPARDFLSGFPIPVGAQLIGGAHRPLVDTKPFPRGY